MSAKSDTKKVLFIIPNVIGIYTKPATPHVGIAYLAAICRKYNHQVRVVDMRLDNEWPNLSRIISSFSPDLIGVYSSSFQHKKSYNIISKIKQHFNCFVAVGGPHPSTILNKILIETKADIAVYGEGEDTLAEILNDKKLKDIKGVIWRNKKGTIIVNPPREYITDLDKIPFPAYGLFDLDRYLDKKITIVSSRGCPGNCIYCSIKMIFGRSFRTRSPENVLKEIEYWHEKGYRHFQFTDDCFSYDKERAEKICDLIIKKDLNIQWELRNGIRVDTVNKNLLTKMKNAGCNVIAFGIESSDPEVLRKMGKGITLEQVKEAITITHKLGIKTVGFFMIGTPGDTFEKFKRSLAFAKSLPLDEFRFYTTIPYPRTPLFDWVNKNARWISNPDEYLNSFYVWEENPVFETKDFPAAQRKKAFKIAEKFVMEKFLKSQFGKPLGTVAYYVWKNKITRMIAIQPGIKLLSFIRKRGLTI